MLVEARDVALTVLKQSQAALDRDEALEASADRSVALAIANIESARAALKMTEIYNRSHRRVGLQRGRINPNPLALDQPTICQQLQHPSEHFSMRFQIDQPSAAGNRGVVRRVLIQPNGNKLPQRQRVRQYEAIPRSLSIPSKYPINSDRK